MLKIKDNVDLKELEKFGFDMNQTKDEFDQIYSCGELLFVKDTRIIGETQFIVCCDFSLVRKRLNILYDLIQAGIVEKVVE